MLTVPESVLERFRAFSLYNSPYHAHDDGSAIDLYPAGSDPSGGDRPVAASPSVAAPSPVAGEVVAIERVRAPPRPYAPEHDYLVGVDTDDGEATIARILHVDPTGEAGVDVGDSVAVGDALGEPIRAGFFAPWVGHHLHLGFRRPGDDLVRATGSLPLEPDVDVRPVVWDGTGTVVETTETYAVLDRPAHPDPRSYFAAIAGSVPAVDGSRRPIALDGGIPHYDHGGVFGGCSGPVSFRGARIGDADGRTVAWNDPTVTVDGTAIHGLSLAAARHELGAKLICPNLALSVGDEVRVAVD